MTRSVSSAFRTELEASHSSELAIMFVTVTHESLASPIYVNSDIMDFVLGGITYLGAAFSLSLLTDDDQPPKGKVSIHNVDRAIGEAVLLLATPPRVTIAIYARSDFNDANPRTPTGTPTLQYSATGLELRNISCDALQLTGELSVLDIAAEPWPAIRSTIDRLPGLFARAPV